MAAGGGGSGHIVGRLALPPSQPDVQEPLHGGHVGEDREQPENNIRPAKEQKRAETDDAFRSGKNAHFIVEAERFRTGAGVRDEERAGRAGVDKQRARRRMSRVVLNMPEEAEEEEHFGEAGETPAV